MFFFVCAIIRKGVCYFVRLSAWEAKESARPLLSPLLIQPCPKLLPCKPKNLVQILINQLTTDPIPHSVVDWAKISTKLGLPKGEQPFPSPSLAPKLIQLGIP